MYSSKMSCLSIIFALILLSLKKWTTIIHFSVKRLFGTKLKLSRMGEGV